MVDVKKIEFEFKKYMDMYKADPELGRLMQQMTFQELFNEKFMKENSKFTSMDVRLLRRIRSVKPGTSSANWP